MEVCVLYSRSGKFAICMELARVFLKQKHENKKYSHTLSFAVEISTFGVLLHISILGARILRCAKGFCVFPVAKRSNLLTDKMIDSCLE